MRGFSLIEAITVVAILALLATLSFPVYISFRKQSNFDHSVYLTIEALRQARGHSQANLKEEKWGVKLKPEKAIIFTGEEFSPDNAQRSFDLPASVTITGDTEEIVFSRLSGTPESSVDITLSYEDYSQNITVNSQGTIDRTR